VLPAPKITLDVEASQDGRLLTYTIHFDNTGETAASLVTIRDDLPDGSVYRGPASDLVDGVWTRTFEDVSVGAHSVTVAAELPASVGDGEHATNVVTLEYLSVGQSIVQTYAHELVVTLPPPPTPAWVFAAPPAAGSVAVIGLAAYRRRRAPHIEQVFLMHNSGMLIHHWAANASPVRDIDILSGMFVILKEFVRDSFREKAGGLSELQFGDSRMFLAEGDHSILATVVSGDRVNGLPVQIQAAVREFENRHAAELADWGGQLERLPAAREVVENLVRGRYHGLRLAS
jgi:uncharacterized repeat protein (TIGR01451 family)